jgi:hypothetical protein
MYWPHGLAWTLAHTQIRANGALQTDRIYSLIYTIAKH